MAGTCLLLLNCAGLPLATSVQQQTTSGDFVSSFSDQFYGPNVGNGTYTVHYSYPSVVSRGSNFTALISLQVNELNGLQEYVEEFQITVLVAVPNGQGAAANLGSSSPLYPGAIWGPANATIPITQETTGPQAGSINASVNINLATTTRVGYPVDQDHYHTASQLVGNVTIQAGESGNGGGGSFNLGGGLAYLPYVVVGLGVVLVSVGVLFPRIFPEKDVGH